MHEIVIMSLFGNIFTILPTDRDLVSASYLVPLAGSYTPRATKLHILRLAWNDASAINEKNIA